MGKLILKNNNRELLFVLRSGDKHILTGIIFMLIATISDFFQLVVLNVNYPILRYFLFSVSGLTQVKCTAADHCQQSLLSACWHNWDWWHNRPFLNLLPILRNRWDRVEKEKHNGFW